MQLVKNKKNQKKTTVNKKKTVASLKCNCCFIMDKVMVHPRFNNTISNEKTNKVPNIQVPTIPNTPKYLYGIDTCNKACIINENMYFFVQNRYLNPFDDNRLTLYKKCINNKQDINIDSIVTSISINNTVFNVWHKHHECFYIFNLSKYDKYGQYNEYKIIQIEPKSLNIKILSQVLLLPFGLNHSKLQIVSIDENIYLCYNHNNTYNITILYLANTNNGSEQRMFI